jgi:hypothetical protein
MERRTDQARNALYIRTKMAIAARLRRACQDFDEEEFDALVERMALLEIKYSMRRGELAIPRAAISRG